MAEVLAVGASVIAIIQITERIIRHCKFYIGTAREASSDLRNILLEILTLKAIFENLEFLTVCNDQVSTAVKNSSGPDGAIEQCLRAMKQLEGLFPSDRFQHSGQDDSKKRKLDHAMIALAWSLKAKKAMKLLNEISRCKDTISLALTIDAARDMKEIKAKAIELHKMLSESQRRDFYKWLQRTDPSPLHNTARKNYEPGTCDWALRTSEWADWLSASLRCVWIHGIPGAGKTVLISHLIEQAQHHCEQLTEGKAFCVYYYCYFSHNQDEASDFLRWLVSQLCRRTDVLPEMVYKKYKVSHEPSLTDLLKALEEVLEFTELVYVFVDAIDESMPRADLLRILSDLGTDHRFQKIQLLASSRDYIDIRSAMTVFSTKVSMANPFVEEDIKRLVRSTLRTNAKLQKWPEDISEDVEVAVSTGAQGMFRWAVCQLDVLQRLKCDRNVIRTALANLPKTLYDTYDRIISMIPEEDRVYALHALHWIGYHSDLFHAGINPEVLVEGVKRSTTGGICNQFGRFHDIDAIQELCGCLIRVSEQSKPTRGPEGCNVETDCQFCCVSFAHYTVPEYLASKHVATTSALHHNFDIKNFKHDLTNVMVSECLSPHPKGLANNIEERCAAWDITPTEIEEDFYTFCVTAVLWMLQMREEELPSGIRLPELTITILDPCGEHFHTLELICLSIEHVTSFLISDGDQGFWSVRWEGSSNDMDAMHLIILLLCDKYAIFLTTFLDARNTTKVLGSTLMFHRELWKCNGINQVSGLINDYMFVGSVIEVIALDSDEHGAALSVLLGYGKGLYDPSKVLYLILCNVADFEVTGRLLRQLLDLGADPNLSRYGRTPLQLGIASLGLEIVRTLLEAGADPDGIGQGIAKEPTSQKLYLIPNDTPLCISKNHKALLDDEDDRLHLEEISALLIQYGAHEIPESRAGSRSRLT